MFKTHKSCPEGPFLPHEVTHQRSSVFKNSVSAIDSFL